VKILRGRALRRIVQEVIPSEEVSLEHCAPTVCGHIVDVHTVLPFRLFFVVAF